MDKIRKNKHLYESPELKYFLMPDNDF